MQKLSIVTLAATVVIFLAPLSFVTAPVAAPNNPKTPNKPSADTYSCRDQLGFLRRVYDDELDGISDSNRVWVTPVCEGEDFGLMRSDGNAGALRGHIASNEAIMHALLGKDFRPDDVVGIRMTSEDSVILYVHPFRH